MRALTAMAGRRTRHHGGMSDFERLVAEGASVPTEGWDFSWFEGRATEARPSWGYADLLARRLGTVPSALDLQTGGGEVLDHGPSLPADTVATEGWPANVELARRRLGPRGVEIVEHDGVAALPFDDARFALVSSRHPIATQWAEIARVLAPGGTYLAQHVGPSSVFELTEHFLGPQPLAVHESRHERHDRAGALAAGLRIERLRTERLRMTFADVGAIVHFLRKVPWIVPGFDPTDEAQRERLRALHDRIGRDGMVVAHSSRILVEAVRPA